MLCKGLSESPKLLSNSQAEFLFVFFVSGKGRDKTRVIVYRCPGNTAVQVTCNQLLIKRVFLHQNVRINFDVVCEKFILMLAKISRTKLVIRTAR